MVTFFCTESIAPLTGLFIFTSSLAFTSFNSDFTFFLFSFAQNQLTGPLLGSEGLLFISPTFTFYSSDFTFTFFMFRFQFHYLHLQLCKESINWLIAWLRGPFNHLTHFHFLHIHFLKFLRYAVALHIIKSSSDWPVTLL